MKNTKTQKATTLGVKALSTVLLVFAVLACTKKTDVVPGMEAETTKPNTEKISCYLNGREASLNDVKLAKYTFIKDNTLNAFDTNEEYVHFLIETRNKCDQEEKGIYEYQLKANELTNQIAKYADEHNLSDTDNIPEDLQATFDQLDNLKQTYNSGNNLRTTISGEIYIFAHPDFNGAHASVFTPLPILYGLDRQVSSISVSGVSGNVTLRDRTFFRGSQITLWSSISNLAWYGWDDRARSIH